MICILVGVFSFLWLGCSFAMPINDGTCKSYINVYCTRCHRTERICTALQELDRKNWKKTLKTMAEYANLDRQERKNAAACIKFFQSNAAAICK